MRRFWLGVALVAVMAGAGLSGQSADRSTVEAPARPGSGPAIRRDSAARPRVRLIATGGTIANRTRGRLSADELVASVPDLDRYVRPEAEQFANLPSNELTLDQWVDLSRRVNDLFKSDPELAGVVITSGTDTLEEVAYFLHLTVRSERPVVVVGSMRSPGSLGYEGAANLLEGFRVAADPASRGKGVLVVLNDEINSAREVTKTNAVRLQTFEAPYGVLGVVDADRVVYRRSVVARHTTTSEFDVTRITTLPRVDIVMVYQGAPGDLIKAAVDHGAKGIVIAAAGAGVTSGTQMQGISYAIEKGAFVVTATRTGSGRIAAPPSRSKPSSPDGREFSSKSSLQVLAEDIPPLKARILLMLALTTTTDGWEIQRIFTEY